MRRTEPAGAVIVMASTVGDVPFCLFLFSSFFYQYVDGAKAAFPLTADKVNVVLKAVDLCPKKMQGENGLRLLNLQGHNPKGRPYEFLITNADANLDFPIDDKTIRGGLHVAQWTSRGGWKTGVHNIRLPQMCNALTTFFKNAWDPIAVALYGHKVGCPIPKVHNTKLRNVTINTRSPFMGDFASGKWRIDVLFESFEKFTATTKACLRVVIETLPTNSS